MYWHGEKGPSIGNMICTRSESFLLENLTDVLAWRKRPIYRQHDLYNAFGARRTQIHLPLSPTTASSIKSVSSSSAGQVSATLSLADLTFEAVTRLPWRNGPLLAE